MALEVTSGAVSSLQKVAKPVEMPEQRAVEKTADVSTVSSSAQIERQVATKVEQGKVGEYNENAETQAAANGMLQQSGKLESAVKRANTAMKMARTHCQFAVHEGTNRVCITVIDDETKEVIREIPSEESLELVQRAWEMAGLFVDERR